MPATGVRAHRRAGAEADDARTRRAARSAWRRCDVGNVEPEIKLTWLRGGVDAGRSRSSTRARPFGRFPVGVWGPPQDPNNRKVPKAEMIEALNELDLACVAAPSGGGPEIPYYQVEIGKRRPLPFTRAAADVSALRTSGRRA